MCDTKSNFRIMDINKYPFLPKIHKYFVSKYKMMIFLYFNNIK